MKHLHAAPPSHPQVCAQAQASRYNRFWFPCFPTSSIRLQATGDGAARRPGQTDTSGSWHQFELDLNAPAHADERTLTTTAPPFHSAWWRRAAGVTDLKIRLKTLVQ